MTSNKFKKESHKENWINYITNIATALIMFAVCIIAGISRETTLILTGMVFLFGETLRHIENVKR